MSVIVIKVVKSGFIVYVKLFLQENSLLHHDKVQLEKGVTEKIAYLQRHKVSE